MGVKSEEASTALALWSRAQIWPTVLIRASDSPLFKHLRSSLRMELLAVEVSSVYVNRSRDRAQSCSVLPCACLKRHSHYI